MTSTAIDLSAIRTDQTSYKGTFRALIGVYSTAEVDSLIAGVGGGSVVWGDIGGELSNQTDLQNALNAKQPIDATLTALAGVTTAADQVIYATGVDTFSVTALSAFGRSLIDDASASAARTTLGLGDIATLAASAKQDSDATLTAFSGLTIAADKLPYGTGSDTFATTDLTAFGRSLIDDADASTARSTLGLGTIATLASTAKQDTDATLTALAGVTTAADKLIYATGSDTFSTTDFTSFARTLVDDTTASAARTTLGALGGALGSVDNKVLRSDGTGGVTAQDSAVTIDDSGNVTGVGSLAISSGTITASTPTSFAQTWNSSGVTFVGLSVAVTDTASANGSKIFVAQAGTTGEIAIKKVASAVNNTAAFRLVFGDSVSIAYSPEYGSLMVRNGTNSAYGNVYVANISGTGQTNFPWYVASSHAEMADSTVRGSGRAFTCANTAGFHWSSTSSVSGSADTGFNRNAAGVVEINNGTVNTYRDLKARNITATALVFLGAYTVGTLPTASSNTGAMAYVTDSSVTAFNSTVSGGGSSVVPVFSNGTNWVVA